MKKTKQEISAMRVRWLCGFIADCCFMALLLFGIPFLCWFTQFFH